MDYIVNYISDLLAGFLMNTSSINSSASAYPTTLIGAGCTTTEMGTALMNHKDSDSKGSSSLMQTAGTAITSTGTGVSLNANKTYQNMIHNEQVTQAYVKSLNDEELSTLIAKVENKEIIETNNKVMKLK